MKLPIVFFVYKFVLFYFSVKKSLCTTNWLFLHIPYCKYLSDKNRHNYVVNSICSKAIHKAATNIEKVEVDGTLKLDNPIYNNQNDANNQLKLVFDMFVI